MKTFLRVLIVVLFVSTVSYGGDMFKHSRTKLAKKRYISAIAKAKVEYDKKVADAQKKYKRDLEVSLKYSMKVNDLDEANKIKAEIEKETTEVESWVVGEWTNDSKDKFTIKKDGSYNKLGLRGNTEKGTWVIVSDKFIIDRPDGISVVFKKINKDRLKRISTKTVWYFYRQIPILAVMF